MDWCEVVVPSTCMERRMGFPRSLVGLYKLVVGIVRRPVLVLVLVSLTLVGFFFFRPPFGLSCLS